MSQINGFGNVVLPARDLEPSITAWSALLGQPPAFRGDDFAIFTGQGVEIGLTSKPWVDHPLVFWTVDDIEAAHRRLLAAGATAMVEVADGSLAELGTGDVANGDPATGIVDVPGGRLAVVKAADGNLLGLNQAVAMDWGSTPEAGVAARTQKETFRTTPRRRGSTPRHRCTRGRGRMHLRDLEFDPTRGRPSGDECLPRQGRLDRRRLALDGVAAERDGDPGFWTDGDACSAR